MKDTQIGLHKPHGVLFLGHQGAGEEIRRNQWETTCRVEECARCRGWHVVYQDWVLVAMKDSAA